MFPWKHNMKTIGINGSPRKNGNTAKLIEMALTGAQNTGSTTELIHLFDLNFKGCKSCLSCKRKCSPSFGRCTTNDDLTEILTQIGTADVLLLGSPIYYGSVTGEMRSFLERLLFPYMPTARPDAATSKGSLKVGFIYAMGMPAERFEKLLKPFFDFSKEMFCRDFGNLKTLYCFDTILSEDQTNYDFETISSDELEFKKKQFKIACAQANDFGKQLAESVTQ